MMHKAVFIVILLISLNIFNKSYAEPPVFVSNMVDAVALSENTGKKIFILFTANWCPSCRCIKEDIENNEKVLDDYIVYYIDYDKNPELIKEYKVKKIPDYLIIEDKIEIKRNIGYFGFDMFKKWLKHNE